MLGRKGREKTQVRRRVFDIVSTEASPRDCHSSGALENGGGRPPKMLRKVFGVMAVLEKNKGC